LRRSGNWRRGRRWRLSSLGWWRLPRAGRGRCVGFWGGLVGWCASTESARRSQGGSPTRSNGSACAPPTGSCPLTQPTLPRPAPTRRTCRRAGPEPQILVADESVASLDASSRGEILDLLLRLRDSCGLSVLLITHNLATAWQIADRIAVLHQGRIVETGPAEQVRTQPKHLYTRALLNAHTTPFSTASLPPGNDPAETIR